MTEPPDDVLAQCTDGEGHLWGKQKLWFDRKGREWMTYGCTKCNAGTFCLLDDPESSMEVFLDMLAVYAEHHA